MKNPLQPTGDQIVMVPVEVPKYSGGILLTHNNQDAPYSKVVAVGPFAEDVEVGDLVMYDKSAAHVLNLKGQDYIIVSESNCLATVTEGK